MKRAAGPPKCQNAQSILGSTDYRMRVTKASFNTRQYQKGIPIAESRTRFSCATLVIPLVNVARAQIVTLLFF